MIHTRKLTIVLLIVFSACKTIKVDYEPLAVDQENAYRFTKITTEDETLVVPEVSVDPDNPTRLRFNTATLLAISPDGTDMAYVGFKDGKKNIFIRSLQSGKATIQRTFREYATEPAYSKDGKQIAFIDRKSDYWNVSQINALEGAAIQQVSSAPALEFSPAYSPKSELFFARKESSRYYIWSYNMESGMFSQYCEGFNPDLDSEGSKVYICRNNNKTGNGEIWSVDLQKGIETRILGSDETGFTSPKISPDGKWIVCTGVSKSSKTVPLNLDIYIVETNGNRLTQLTYHPGHDCSPQWSADGKYIYFLSQRGNKTGIWNIWKMNFKL